MKFDTWEETFESVRDILAKETQCHEELLTSEKCDKYDRQKYEDLESGNVNEVRGRGFSQQKVYKKETIEK